MIHFFLFFLENEIEITSLSNSLLYWSTYEWRGDDDSSVLPVSHRLKGLVLGFSASAAQVGRCQNILPPPSL